MRAQGAAVLIVSLSFFVRPQPAAVTSSPLELRQPIERELGPHQADVFTVQAQAGQYLGIIVRPRGANVNVVVADPANKKIAADDLARSSQGRKSVLWIAEVSGMYSIAVSKSAPSGASGSYEIELLERRAPTEEDCKRIEAQTRMYKASANEQAPDQGSHLEAIRLYEEAASLWHGTGAISEEELCVGRTGAVYMNLSDYAKALEYFEHALALSREISDRAGEAVALNGVGAVQYRLAEYQEALGSYQLALSIHREIGDKPGEAQALHGIAVAFFALGEPQKSLEYSQRQLAIAQSIGDNAGQTLALANIGIFYYALDEAQKAINTCQQLVVLDRAQGDRIGEAHALSMLGNIYRDMGTDEALDYYDQAIEIERKLADRAGECNTLTGMGDVYFFMGAKEKSIGAYRQAVDIAREMGDRSSEALALVGVANVYADLGSRQKRQGPADPDDMQKALADYKQALDIGRSLGSPVVQVFALIGDGVAYSALGEKQKALDMIKQALFLFSVVRYRPGEGWAMYEMARVERDRGNLTEALNLAAKARDMIESLRTKVVSQELRATFFAAVQDCYTLEMDVLMRLHAADPSQDYQAKALTASERTRARVLLETLREANADIRQGVDPQLLDRERTVQVLLNAKEMLRIQMTGSRHTAEQSAEVEKAVHDLAAQYEEIHTQILVGSPRYAALNFPQPLSVPEIQKEVLDPDTLLLEFALGEERGFLWVVSTTAIRSVTLPRRADVEEAARTFYNALKDPETQRGGDESGRILSRMLLGEVEASLGHKRLLIVADGALQYLPFTALPDPSAPGQPLVASHEIVNVPSASTLAVLRRENAGRKPAPRTLAILADPVFNNDDSRVTPSPHRALELHLSRLPGTRREAEAIASLVPESQRKLTLDFDASRATLTSPEMNQYRMIHLATHGLLNSEHPELSGIVLSLVDRQGRKLDGFVRLNEIYNLKLSADLVVLSACQTALGKEIRGEGLVGLTRGFMYAGAPRVVASLWKVDDRATAELMKRFYGAMLRPGSLPPAAALREAEIALSKTKGWESPHYWAAFTLQGEWR
jgi:CHAT domain-containing protein